MVGMAALALTGTCLAAPRGGHGGHGGNPPRQVQPKTQTRPAAKPTPAPTRHANPRPAPTRHANPRPAPTRHADPRPVPTRHANPRPAPVRRHFDRHHLPAGARFWARPHYCPPPRFGARHVWTWVEAEWAMYLDGVYCYGDGYYYDGYTYFYNGAYYTQPPVLLAPVDGYW